MKASSHAYNKLIIHSEARPLEQFNKAQQIQWTLTTISICLKRRMIDRSSLAAWNKTLLRNTSRRRHSCHPNDSAVK